MDPGPEVDMGIPRPALYRVPEDKRGAPSLGSLATLARQEAWREADLCAAL